MVWRCWLLGECGSPAPGMAAAYSAHGCCVSVGMPTVLMRPCRFYGGVKLGAGGLVRAYGGAARDCLRAARKQQMTPLMELRMQVCCTLRSPGHKSATDASPLSASHIRPAPFLCPRSLLNC